MRHRLRQVKSRRTCAAGGVLATCGVLAAVGAAGAAQEAEVTVGVGPGNVFDPNAPAVVDVDTGDTVVWEFSGANGTAHNVKADTGPPEDPTWAAFVTEFKTEGEVSRFFGQPGTYTFLCQAHPGMAGILEVTGEPVDPEPTVSPSPSPSPSLSPSPSATPAPAPDDHTSTPAPTASASADKGAPALSGVKVKRLRRGARVTFALSEPATVTLRFEKKSGKVVRTISLQARPGKRTVRVRSARLKRGRYTVELQARDAAGNRSAPLRTALRIRR